MRHLGNVGFTKQRICEMTGVCWKSGTSRIFRDKDGPQV